jgi:hypothetical protein
VSPASHRPCQGVAHQGHVAGIVVGHDDLRTALCEVAVVEVRDPVAHRRLDVKRGDIAREQRYRRAGTAQHARRVGIGARAVLVAIRIRLQRHVDMGAAPCRPGERVADRSATEQIRTERNVVRGADARQHVGDR